MTATFTLFKKKKFMRIQFLGIFKKNIAFKIKFWFFVNFYLNYWLVNTLYIFLTMRLIKNMKSFSISSKFRVQILQKLMKIDNSQFLMIFFFCQYWRKNYLKMKPFLRKNLNEKSNGKRYFNLSKIITNFVNEKLFLIEKIVNKRRVGVSLEFVFDTFSCFK
jgi:hypothetical protein